MSLDKTLSKAIWRVLVGLSVGFHGFRSAIIYAVFQLLGIFSLTNISNRSIASQSQAFGSRLCKNSGCILFFPSAFPIISSLISLEKSFMLKHSVKSDWVWQVLIKFWMSSLTLLACILSIIILEFLIRTKDTTCGLTDSDLVGTHLSSSLLSNASLVFFFMSRDSIVLMHFLFLSAFRDASRNFPVSIDGFWLQKELCTKNSSDFSFYPATYAFLKLLETYSFAALVSRPVNLSICCELLGILLTISSTYFWNPC